MGQKEPFCSLPKMSINEHKVNYLKKKKVALDRTLETVMKPLPDFYPLVCLVT